MEGYIFAVQTVFRFFDIKLVFYLRLDVKTDVLIVFYN